MSLVAAAGALGLLLIYAGITSPGRHRPTRRRPVSAPTVTVMIGAGAAVGVVSSAFGARPAAAVVLGTLAVWVVVAMQRSRHRKRERIVREAWPDAIADLMSSVRAGVSLPEACMHLGHAGPDPLRGGFDRFAGVYRSTGSFAASLDVARESFSDPIADRVFAALRIAHEVGGTDLVAFLQALAEFLSSDLAVRQEIEARWSWTVTAARVAASAPWIVLLLMSTRPEAARAYSSPAGAWVMVAGAVATVAGYQAMLAAGRLPGDRRLS